MKKDQVNHNTSSDNELSLDITEVMLDDHTVEYGGVTSTGCCDGRPTN